MKSAFGCCCTLAGSSIRCTLLRKAVGQTWMKTKRPVTRFYALVYNRCHKNEAAIQILLQLTKLALEHTTKSSRQCTRSVVSYFLWQTGKRSFFALKFFCGLFFKLLKLNVTHVALFVPFTLALSNRKQTPLMEIQVQQPFLLQKQNKATVLSVKTVIIRRLANASPYWFCVPHRNWKCKKAVRGI